MIWRQWDAELDREAILRLSREPMAGSVPLHWGFAELSGPPGCSSPRVYVLESKNNVMGSGISWDWPGGHRYLSGLRFCPNIQARPTPTMWKSAFTNLLEGSDFAWTSIGTENHRARRLLESKLRVLPHYQPRQNVVTWFVPLGGRQRRAPVCHHLDNKFGLVDAHWRHVAIGHGQGWIYKMGRLLNRSGLPGIPPPGKPLKLAYWQPDAGQSIATMRAVCREAQGYDGLVVVLPGESDVARRWGQAAPRLSWQWHSTLYSVSWNDEMNKRPIPEWKGYWL